MKSILLFMLLPCLGYGQSVEIQQLVLNMEKLAQLKATYQTMLDGYRTLEKGYNQVRDLSKDNFLLHKDYLDGLLAVSPSVQQYGRIQAMVQQHTTLVQEYTTNLRQLQAGRMLQASELYQVKSSMAELVHHSATAVDELVEVLTPGRLRMSDEERISMIHRLDAVVSENLQELRAIALQYRNLVDRRALKKKELQRMKILYGIQR